MRKLAKRFKVSAYFVFTLLKQFRQTGKLDPKPHGGGRRTAIETQDQNFIKNLLSRLKFFSLKKNFSLETINQI